MSRPRAKPQSTTKPTGLLPGPEPWHLAPEGGLIHLGRKLAVIADVHLGLEWARGRAGDLVPAHSLAQTRAKLARLFDRTPIAELIVAGDLVESHRPCPQTARDVVALADWLKLRGVDFVTLRGNHDRWVGDSAESREVDGWTIAHGHQPFEASKRIIGHFHPGLAAGPTCWPCFLVGPTSIILPAFSADAAGFDLRIGKLPRQPDRDYRCIASTGSELLDFGPLGTLAERLVAAGLETAGRS